MQSGLDPPHCWYPQPAPLQQPHILNPKGQQADWGWIGAQHFNVFPNWTEIVSRGVFHPYHCLTIELHPAESIISFTSSLNMDFTRWQSIHTQVHLQKGAEVLTRDIYFYWRTSLERIWGFDTQKKRNKAANSICNDLFLSYNIARVLASTEANGEVGIMTDGIPCPAPKGFDSVNKWELGYLNLLSCKNNLALKIKSTKKAT